MAELSERPSTAWGFEPFGTAVAVALVAGALSLVDHRFEPLVGVLAALAVAGRAVRRPPHPRESLSTRTLVAFLLLGGAFLLYVGVPVSLGSARGLVLAAGLLPLWVDARGRARPSYRGAAVP